ncbi:Pkinase-domain-containing protein [Guyanagaster necrorhizus]|uniref:Pkinase-domain-containing protein n=1 Tax=Guyanagaster necrorhizus TaxID=856835 RepID=A0A9P7VZT6_9AGAR|nr:Pkinase-domain-containing protein [Guyanagaster necrorhizus MCA 3950]KAG7450163.1 Pkinase-domain-containing protein [Guyanagaster necrorhizus MCA 3950]
MPMRRHTPTLYSHPEDDVGDGDDETAWGPLPSDSAYSPSFAASSSSGRLRSHTSLPVPLQRSHSSFSSVPSATKYPDLYAQFQRRYRNTEPVDPRDDPDSHYNYFQKDVDSDDEDAPRLLGADGRDRKHLLGENDPQIQASSAEEQARLEWQVLFASVLAGDVLKSEKTRIQRVLESSSDRRNNIKLNIWLGLRSSFHGTTLEEERKAVEERRLRIVDPIIDEVVNFRYNPHNDDSALKQVNDLLARLDIAQSLYPNLKHFLNDKPITKEATFQERWDALNTYSTILTRLRDQISLLQRWTGSENLDVTQPNTSAEQPIGTNVKSSSGATEIADSSSFVERVLKEESMQTTFEKGFLGSVHEFIGGVRAAQVTFASSFETMSLPTFETEVRPLIAFPTKLAQACLHLRMEYTQSLRNPEVMIIDQMTEDLRLSIGLACTLKRQYEAFLAPDPSGSWNLSQCISGDYEDSILQAVTLFFKLIHLKLKSGVKGINETDILEAQWPTMIDVSLTVTGGSARVAEQLCSTTNRLMVRMINYFDTQVRVPTGENTQEHRHKHSEYMSNPMESNASTKSRDHSPGHSDTFRVSSDEQKVNWYNKLLESVRLRYRKLQRYARMLNQRFTNAAEYSLDDIIIDDFFDYLSSSGFVLVYTYQFEEEGFYVLASPNLIHKEATIARIMQDAYNPSEILSEDRHMVYGDEEEISGKDKRKGEKDFPAQYLLVLSPRAWFVWRGQIAKVPDIPKMDLALADNRMRLIADGGLRRLTLAKEAFAQTFALDETGEMIEHPVIPMTCIADWQAHYSSVDRELQRMNRSTMRLAESIVDSVHHVRSTMTISMGCHELMESWYLFAAEHGQHAQRHLEKSSSTGFNRLMIKLAISWLNFICNDCNPDDQKTFRWAVNALEFTFQSTVRNILNLPDKQFQVLRSGVAMCMMLLTGHFDILGARSNILEKEKQEQLAKQKIAVTPLDDFHKVFSQDNGLGTIDVSARKYWEKAVRSLQRVDEERERIGTGFHTIGRVLDDEKPEDRSLVYLANSSSNIAIRWQQGKFIGAGAFGSVYVAVNLDSGSLMAVKEIKNQEVGVRDLYAEIKDELSVMEMLQHPNIVEYYGIEVHRDKVYIFEEYCQGGSLAAWLEHGRIEDELLIQVYTIQMLDGLAYLHSQGIVHRDIKPDNILLDHMGVIKFVDFGAAKIVAKKSATRRSSEHLSAAVPDGAGKFNNSLTGTPMYMSPEIIKNDKRGRHGAMDIWSLGCVVLEFATGKKPWSNLDNEWAIMFHIGVATQHPPLPEPGQLSELGIDFIKQCLTIDAMKRPTALELREHPWMLDFRNSLLQEQELEVSPDENGAVARQALLMQEKQAEILKMASPEATPESILDVPGLLTPVDSSSEVDF